MGSQPTFFFLFLSFNFLMSCIGLIICFCLYHGMGLRPVCLLYCGLSSGPMLFLPRIKGHSLHRSFLSSLIEWIFPRVKDHIYTNWIMGKNINYKIVKLFGPLQHNHCDLLCNNQLKQQTCPAPHCKIKRTQHTKIQTYRVIG